MLVILFASALAAAPTQPLSLPALLEQARRSNPVIGAARGRQAAAAAIPSQVRALPDPMASVSYTNETLDRITLGDAEDSFLTLTWQQELPYPGKRRLAGEAAMEDAEVAASEVDQRELEILTGVKQAYANLYRLDRATAILSGNKLLLGSFLETARARYESGEGLLQNVLKAQTEIAKIEADLEILRQERAGAEAGLKALIGDTAGPPLGPALDLPEPAPAIETSSLEREALARSPEVRTAEAASRAGEARLALARRQLKPDFSYSAAYSYRGDLDPMVMGMLGLRLPIYRRSKQAQGVVQAAAELDAAGQELVAARLRVAAEVRDLASRAERAASLSEIYSESIIPQARSSLESASAAYGVGRVDFLTLLSDFGALLQYELDYEVQRAERVSALAGLERLTTLPLLSDESHPTEEARP